MKEILVGLKLLRDDFNFYFFQCVEDSRSLNDKVVNFIKHNSLMHDAVPNFFHKPLIIDSKSSARFTQIAVHSQVTAVSGRKYDIMFVGTGNNGLNGDFSLNLHGCQ